MTVEEVAKRVLALYVKIGHEASAWTAIQKALRAEGIDLSEGEIDDIVIGAWERAIDGTDDDDDDQPKASCANRPSRRI